MKVIDFRFRPNRAEIVSGITNSAMFKNMCAAGEFMKPQSLAEIVQDLKQYHVVKAVITGRDGETTYGTKSNNGSVIEFVQKYPDKFIGFAGLDPHKGMRAITELKRFFYPRLTDTVVVQTGRAELTGSSVASLNGLSRSRTHSSVLSGGHLRRQSSGRCSTTQHIIKENPLWSNCL